MRHVALPIVAVLLCLASGPTAQALESVPNVDTILTDICEHGYNSPTEVIRQLQAAPDRPGQGTSAPLRIVYYGTLGRLAIIANDKSLLDKALAGLATKKNAATCTQCTAQQWVLRAQSVVNNNPSKALVLLSKARPMLGDRTPPSLLIHWHRIHSLAESNIGNLDDSVKDAIAGYHIAIRHNDAAAQVQMGMMLALNNTKLGDFQRADKQIANALDLAQKIGYGDMLPTIQLNLGYIRGMENRRHQQRDALLKAYALVHGKPNFASSEAIVLANLSDYYLSQNDGTQALRFARKAAKLTRSRENIPSLNVATANIGIALTQLGQIDRGITTLKQAINMAKEADQREYTIAMLDALIDIYEKAGRYKEASATLHEVAGYQHKLTEQQRKLDVLSLQVKFDAERKTRKIKLLSIENERQQALADAHATQQRLWIAVAIALALGAIMLLQWLWRVRRSNQQLNETNLTLSEESSRDPLTNTFNRRHFEAMMTEYQQRAREPSALNELATFGLVLLDIDHFKHINDMWGHDGGDVILEVLANRLRGLLRLQDAVVRWGGEEFVLVLPGTDHIGMKVLLKRLLHTIGATPIIYKDQPITVTVSAGSVIFPMQPGQSWKSALQIADLAMYASKAGGRNRATCVAPVAKNADLAYIADNLATAQSAGDVETDTIAGPVANHANP